MAFAGEARLSPCGKRVPEAGVMVVSIMVVSNTNLARRFLAAVATEESGRGEITMRIYLVILLALTGCGADDMIETDSTQQPHAPWWDCEANPCERQGCWCPEETRKVFEPGLERPECLEHPDACRAWFE